MLGSVGALSDQTGFVPHQHFCSHELLSELQVFRFLLLFLLLLIVSAALPCFQELRAVLLNWSDSGYRVTAKMPVRENLSGWIVKSRWQRGEQEGGALCPNWVIGRTWQGGIDTCFKMKERTHLKRVFYFFSLLFLEGKVWWCGVTLLFCKHFHQQSTVGLLLFWKEPAVCKWAAWIGSEKWNKTNMSVQ